MNDDLKSLRKLIDVRVDIGQYPILNGWKCVLCADIVLYFDGWTDTLKLNADGLTDFYREAMALVGTDMRWVLINGEGHFRKVNKKMFDMLPFWVSADGPDQGTYGVNMQGGPEQNGRIDKSFTFHRGVSSYIRLTLPVECMLEDLECFANLAKGMVQRMRFASGSAGLSVNLTPDQWQRNEGEHLYMLSRRFSGLDIGITRLWSKYAIQGLKTVNWLTFLGDGLMSRMGGRNGVKLALPGNAPVTDLNHGAMIQAGPRPLLGDGNTQEDMSAYAGVARALTPLSLPGDVVPPEFGANGGEENTHRWLNRFQLQNYGL